jgi:hypothetical protein
MTTPAPRIEGPQARGQRATIVWLPAERARLRATRAVRRPFEVIEKRLRVEPERVVQLAYGDFAYENKGVIPLALHPSLSWLRVPVRVESFTPVDPHRGTVISIRWTPMRAARLLPTLEADLEVRPGEHGTSELELEGRYRPPLGLAGLVLDRLVGRFVAGSTAKTFLDRVADCIEAP